MGDLPTLKPLDVALATHAVLDLAAGRSSLDGYERFPRDPAQPVRDA